MNIMVRMGQDKEKIKEFLDVLTAYTNVKWRGDRFTPEGFFPNDEGEFDIDIALDLLNAYYFIIEDNILSWDNDEVIFYMSIDKFDLYWDIDEAIKEIKKGKINIRNVVIKATDDKYGNVLIDFLREFTNVTWRNGDKLEGADDGCKGELIYEILRGIEGFEYLIFTIEDNKMYWDIDGYESKLKDDYKDYTWYDSVAEFLKSFSK